MTNLPRMVKPAQSPIRFADGRSDNSGIYPGDEGNAPQKKAPSGAADLTKEMLEERMKKPETTKKTEFNG